MSTPMRPTTDLLELPYSFSQGKPLDISGFADACAQRGLDLWRGDGQLEALHRVGLLTPLFRIAKDTRARLALGRHIYGTEAADMALRQVSTRPRALLAERDARRLHDPRREPFRPWSAFQRRYGQRQQWTSEFLYSPYQLLLLPSMRRALGRTQARRRASGRLRFAVPGDLGTFASIAHPNDDLVFALTALETVYRPGIVGVLAWPDGVTEDGGDWWRDLRAIFDPVATLTWLGWTSDRVLETAQHLIVTAKDLDPLAAWQDLFRLIRPEKWRELRGDALVALDHRIAAEMLLRFYESLVGANAAPPLELPPVRLWSPLRERLQPDRRELDAVLMDFGVSPYPSVVLALEGPTEMALVPRVRDFLEIDASPSFIHLVDVEGVETNLGLLASYVALPAFGDAIEGGVLLTRPPTRLIVVRDAEGSSASEAQREKDRKAWIERVYRQLPKHRQLSSIKEQLDQFVELLTWGDQTFEYAHFTDGEIAEAILDVYKGADAPTFNDLTARVARQRPFNTNLEKLWHDWKGYRPTKPALAIALWPALEGRLRAANSRQALDAIPVARIVLHAAELAANSLRSDVMLRL